MDYIVKEADGAGLCMDFDCNLCYQIIVVAK